MYDYRPNRFNLLPEAVKHILILNIIFFLATLAMKGYGMDLTYSLGLHYPGKEAFEPYQFITYMFMHGSFFHIFFNLFAFWMFGSAIEQVMGTRKFLIYYFITGIGAALLHNLVTFFEINPLLDAIDGYLNSPSFETFQAMINSEAFKNEQLTQQGISMIESLHKNYPLSPELVEPRALSLISDFRGDVLNNLPPVVGASGSVFGVLLAFGMLFPNTIIYLYFAIPVKAKYFVMIYGAIELLLGIKNSPADNIAHFAHLGGMVFGFLLIRYWRLDKY